MEDDDYEKRNNDANYWWLSIINDGLWRKYRK